MENLPMVFILAAVAVVALITCWAYCKAFYMSHRQRNKGYPLPGSEQYARVRSKTDRLYHEMQAVPFEDVWITADDGIRLHGLYHHIDDAAPLQIQFHGYRGSAFRDFCGGHKLARECGHNTLVVDQRAHGKSDGSTISFGIRERHDCLCWLRYAVERFGKDKSVFLSGVSMGAATVLMAAKTIDKCW